MAQFLKWYNFRSGCNVNAKSSGSEKTALAVAAFAGELEVFELLVNHGANGKNDIEICYIQQIILSNSYLRHALF